MRPTPTRTTRTRQVKSLTWLKPSGGYNLLLKRQHQNQNGKHTNKDTDDTDTDDTDTDDTDTDDTDTDDSTKTPVAVHKPWVPFSAVTKKTCPGVLQMVANYKQN